jgi:hypothetical protein
MYNSDCFRHDDIIIIFLAMYKVFNDDVLTLKNSFFNQINI